MSATRKRQATEVPGLLGYDEGPGEVRSPQRFKAGDRVEWTSQSAGTVKRKVGEVVAVVRAGTEVKKYLPPDAPASVANRSFGWPRRHESYLVRVGKTVYWPLVRHLHPDKSCRTADAKKTRTCQTCAGQGMVTYSISSFDADTRTEQCSDCSGEGLAP